MLTPPYDGYLKAELEDEANARGIDISDGPLKPDLISRLEADDRTPAPEPAPPPPAETAAEPVPATVPPLPSAEPAEPGDQRPVPPPAPYPSDDDLRVRVDAAAGRATSGAAQYDPAAVAPVGGLPGGPQDTGAG